MFDTFGILLREGARVFQRSVESVAIRLLARTPPLLARVFTLGGAAPRAALEVASKVEEEVVETVGKAVEEVAEVAAPLVVASGLRRFATPRRLATAVVVLAGAAAGAALLKRGLRRR
ncbi:MAG TPA: hypothetical protein VHX66_08835 [Solirubrobacteraceae bacterium]|jgi:hypothetical protein|nr:hypothetical protein [Solirubrobacteraceae bacterium]